MDGACLHQFHWLDERGSDDWEQRPGPTILDVLQRWELPAARFTSLYVYEYSQHQRSGPVRKFHGCGVISVDNRIKNTLLVPRLQPENEALATETARGPKSN